MTKENAFYQKKSCNNLPESYFVNQAHAFGAANSDDDDSVLLWLF